MRVSALDYRRECSPLPRGIGALVGGCHASKMGWLMLAWPSHDTVLKLWDVSHQDALRISNVRFSRAKNSIGSVLIHLRFVTFFLVQFIKGCRFPLPIAHPSSCVHFQRSCYYYCRNGI